MKEGDKGWKENDANEKRGMKNEREWGTYGLGVLPYSKSKP